MSKQCDQVLQYLESVGPMTPMDALREFGIMRLGARIFDLKKKGYLFHTRTITSINRFGSPVHFAEYSLRPPAPL